MFVRNEYVNNSIARTTIGPVTDDFNIRIVIISIMLRRIRANVDFAKSAGKLPSL